jgi:hypothetical protein
MTSAVSGLSAALYRDDPDAESVVFTDLELVDSGDHLTYQVAKWYSYWDENEILTIEKQIEGAGEYAAITTGFTVNYLRGSITFDEEQDPDDNFQATGKRRDETNFEKVMLLYDGKLKIDGKEIDTTSCDDAGWGNTISGARSWEFTAGAFYYDGAIPIEDVGSRLISKFYSNYTGEQSFVGKGSLQSLDHLLANPNEAQKQTITLKCVGEIYPEL